MSVSARHDGLREVVDCCPVFETERDVMYVEIVQWFKLFFLPAKPLPARYAYTFVFLIGTVTLALPQTRHPARTSEGPRPLLYIATG